MSLPDRQFHDVIPLRSLRPATNVGIDAEGHSAQDQDRHNYDQPLPHRYAPPWVTTPVKTTAGVESSGADGRAHTDGRARKDA